MICVFTGGDAPSPKSTEYFFKEKRKEQGGGDFQIKSIAADSGLDTFENYQSELGFFSIKSILGDWDSIEDKKKTESYPKEIVETHIVDKDYTDTELALEKAHSMKESPDEEIVLIGAGGGKRIDHLIAVYDLFSTPLRPDTWITGEQFLHFLGEGKSAEISNLKENDTVSVLRTSESRTGGRIESKGLKWESKLFRMEGVPSISNRISESADEEIVEISAVEGNFVLALPNSAKVEMN